MKKKPIQVLLVEDNPGDARLFREYLLEDGLAEIKLDHVERLKTGLEYLTQEKPDVILLDLGLPDSQGLETFTRFFAQAPGVPIVVLTGFIDSEQAVEAVKSGAQDYLVKGEVSGGVLVRSIRYAIERKQSEEALYQSNAFNTMLLQTVPFGMDIVNEAGQILFINTAMEKLVGKDPLGKRCWDLYKDDMQQCKDCPLKNEFGLGKTNTIDSFGVLGGRIFEISHTGMIFQGQKAILEVFHDITARKQAEEEVRHRLNELEVLYASSQAFGQLLQPKEIGKKTLDILSERLQWHHATIHLYHPESETLELLASHQPGLGNEAESLAAEERFRTKIALSGQGFTSWVIQHGQPIYCGDVTKDRRYIEVWPEIRSGMYVPLKVGQRTIGCLNLESERVNAFTETDEWLITTLAMQAASALENARMYEEARQRLAESEAVGRITIALRTAESLDNMMPVFLDETLTLLGTQVGAIWLHHTESEELRQVVSRGWFTELPKTTVKPGEGLVGSTYANGKAHLSREFIRDVSALDASLKQIPAGWGGVCVPIRSAQAVVGVMLISVQLPRELTTGDRQVLDTLAEIVGIAIQRMRLHDQTERQLQHVRALHEIDTVIAASFDLSLTLDIFLKNVLAQLCVDAASILLLNPYTHMLDYTAGKGFRMPGIEKMHLSLSEEYAGRVVRERHTIHTADLQADNTSAAYTKLTDNEGFVSYYGVPLIVKGEVKGVLEIFHRTQLKLNPELLSFMEALAGQAAIAIDSSLTYTHLQRSNMDLAMTYDMTLEGWSRALDMRDKETEGHSERVAEMTLQLASDLAVKDVEMEHIQRGALLHDMGKIAIPDSILLKPGSLTADEWDVMHTHPTRAYEMLAHIPYLRPALEIPYNHHEKWDGSGYPRGLKGEEIPLSARIFAVVDVYDALTSNRPYRPAWTKEKTLEHIRQQSGFQFDPKVVEAFLRLIPNLKQSRAGHTVF
jgi:PAS domain S-box-containing protein